MFNSKSCFSTFEQTPPLEVFTGDSTSSLLSEGIGTVVLLCNNKIFTLKDCLFVPQLNCNLINLLVICKEKLIITQENGHFKLESNHQTLIEGKIINNLMQVEFSIPKALSTQVTPNIWHQRLGHPGNQGNPQSQDQLTLAWGSHPQRTEIVDEVHPVRIDLEDENSHPVANPCIKVIGPRNPTVYSAHINKSSILPFPQRPRVLVTSVGNYPRTYKKALVSADKDLWVSAIEKELKSMNNLKVWDFVDLKPDYKLVGTTWVFRIKRNHLNKIIEYKTHLCAQGFTQTPGLDFNKTYAPTGLLNSLWILIAFAVSNNLEFHQVDVKSAFLNAPLIETVYLSIPQCLGFDKRKLCLRLNKAIYSLKQAPLAWTKCPMALCPCQQIVIFSSSASSFNEEIAREFDIKDIGPADLMVGVKISRSGLLITLDQQHFTAHCLSESKSVSTPLLPNFHFSPATREEISKFNLLGVSYRSAIGSINYLCTVTRPDLAHSVSSLLQFLESPGIQNRNSFLHVLRYLKGTKSIGLFYSKSNVQGIEAYSDADGVIAS
ncbi:hypothetical protein O181_047701 [Austropuccinia psidii MF-1]|uniref:Reverse transcriptase Ty1/copia-type domain-containing protein n=1 Tax=Austropuccinia psidii MF-1 TaxID=1389203 RepID=A0A9Q3HJQ8_9BASI|nr:hypothetical protein [Austropuccinia psidii MF-1]